MRQVLSTGSNSRCSQAKQSWSESVARNGGSNGSGVSCFDPADDEYQLRGNQEGLSALAAAAIRAVIFEPKEIDVGELAETGDQYILKLICSKDAKPKNRMHESDEVSSMIS